MVNFQFKYNEALRKARDYLAANPFLKDIFPELRIEEKQESNFFVDLATALRKLWPEGEKDGKYSWRDSVPNLTNRLKLLWELRGLEDYSLEECLVVARKYIAQFRSNVRYMKTLKYFILRQNEKVVKDNGMITYINQSTFADMLESGEISREEFTPEVETFEQGELI